MNYFSRLADRSGLTASPRGAVAPIARPAAAATSPGDQPDVADLLPPSEMPASDAPATSAQTTSDPPFAIEPAAPAPFESIGTMPAAASESRLRTPGQFVEPAGPAPSRQIEHDTMPPAPPEWATVVPATQPVGSRPTSQSSAEARAPLQPREIGREAAETPAATADQIVSDAFGFRVDAEAASKRRTPSPQVAAIEPANIRAAENDIEVPPRAGIPTATSPAPETDQDIAVPALRTASFAGRSREERDTTARRHDRTAAAVPRSPAAQGPRGASVEVRIGAVTLQVHAPPAPAALQAPARQGFAPHRHYLRTW